MKMNRKQGNTVLKIVERVARAEVKKNDTGFWCTGIIHQPKRPTK